MSKLSGYFSYKDWCILKHALEKSMKVKEKELFIDSLGSWPKMTFEEKETIKKELEEEKRTLQRVTERTDNFKKYINGNKYY